MQPGYELSHLAWLTSLWNWQTMSRWVNRSWEKSPNNWQLHRPVGSCRDSCHIMRVYLFIYIHWIPTKLVISFFIWVVCFCLLANKYTKNVTFVVTIITDTVEPVLGNHPLSIAKVISKDSGHWRQVISQVGLFLEKKVMSQRKMVSQWSEWDGGLSRRDALKTRWSCKTWLFDSQDRWSSKIGFLSRHSNAISLQDLIKYYLSIL